MSFLTRVRKQQAVYWRQTGRDKYGKYTYAEPVQIACRWTDAFHSVTSAKGDTFVSTASVIVDRVMQLGDRLQLGPLASNTPADPLQASSPASFEVKLFESIPNFRVRWYLWMVHL